MADDRVPDEVSAYMRNLLQQVIASPVLGCAPYGEGLARQLTAVTAARFDTARSSKAQITYLASLCELLQKKTYDSTLDDDSRPSILANGLSTRELRGSLFDAAKAAYNQQRSSMPTDTSAESNGFARCAVRAMAILFLAEGALRPLALLSAPTVYDSRQLSISSAVNTLTDLEARLDIETLSVHLLGCIVDWSRCSDELDWHLAGESLLVPLVRGTAGHMDSISANWVAHTVFLITVLSSGTSRRLYQSADLVNLLLEALAVHGPANTVNRFLPRNPPLSMCEPLPLLVFCYCVLL